MTPAEAEQIIGASGNGIFIGQLIARLAVKTPGVFYRSQDILDNIGNDLLASAFTLAAADHMRNDREDGSTVHWRTETEDEEEINLFSEFSRARYEEPETSPYSEAIDVISGLEPEVLRKVLGRLADRAHGIFVLQPDIFPDLHGQGAGLMMSIGREDISPRSSFRFSACVLMAGEPEQIFILRMLCARQDGPMPAEGQRISEVTLSAQPPTLS